MVVANVTRMGQAAAERTMKDTCLVERPGGKVTDPETGQTVTVFVMVYEGKAKRQTYEGHETAREVVEHTSITQRYSVHFPIGAFDPSPGDRVTWLTSQLNPDLPGTVDRIAAPFKKSAPTAMRLHVDEWVD